MPRELDDDTSPPLLPWGDVEASMVQEGVIPCSCDWCMRGSCRTRSRWDHGVLEVRKEVPTRK
jgi:hypothetical protein